jgi:hypothetical protein
VENRDTRIGRKTKNSRIGAASEAKASSGPLREEPTVDHYPVTLPSKTKVIPMLGTDGLYLKITSRATFNPHRQKLQWQRALVNAWVPATTEDAIHRNEHQRLSNTPFQVMGVQRNSRTRAMRLEPDAIKAVKVKIAFHLARRHPRNVQHRQRAL